MSEPMRPSEVEEAMRLYRMTIPVTEIARLVGYSQKCIARNIRKHVTDAEYRAFVTKVKRRAARMSAVGRVPTQAIRSRLEQTAARFPLAERQQLAMRWMAGEHIETLAKAHRTAQERVRKYIAEVIGYDAYIQIGNKHKEKSIKAWQYKKGVKHEG